MMEDYGLLKKSIETKFGQNIVNSRTAIALVESITVETDDCVSFNTIRRLFNLIDSNQKKMTTHTLDLLSRYCGFRSYQEKLNHNLSTDSWRLINDIGFVSSYSKSDFINLVDRLSQHISRDISGLLSLGMLTNELLHLKDETKLLLLFDIKIKDIYQKNNLKELTNCCNIFANTLRNYKFVNPENLIALSKKEMFVRIYIHHFIDLGFNKNFINFVKNMDDSIFNSTDYAFKYLFLDRYQFLTEHTYNDENKGLEIGYESLSNNFVKGRWIASTYLRDKAFRFNKYFKEGPTSILLATELLVFALIKNDFETIHSVCINYNPKDLWKVNWHIVNEKLILELFLVLDEFKQKGHCSKVPKEIDIYRFSDNQCLEYNKTIYFYIKGIINGFSNDIKIDFKKAKKRTYLSALKIKNH